MDKSCTLYRTAGFMGKRWTLLILLEIYKGAKHSRRYSLLKGSLCGITPKILSLRLRELEREGLVSRRVDASSFPVKCEYSLTRCGRAFVSVVKALKRWALKWKVENDSCLGTDCAHCRL